MSFILHNTNNDDARNEITYNLNSRNAGTTTTVINRGNPTDSNPLLLSDFNTIHYYQHTGSELTNFDISTIMAENAVYEVKFNCSGSSDNNNDMFLEPNYGNYSNSNFYSIYLNSYDIDPESEGANASTKYKSSTNTGGFYVDFFDGYKGYDPVGKITIYNRRNCKKILIEASDTSGSTIASGYWLDNSSGSESYSPDSNTPPSYNTNDIWSSVGTLNFTSGSFTNWSIYVSRVG